MFEPTEVVIERRALQAVLAAQRGERSQCAVVQLRRFVEAPPVAIQHAELIPGKRHGLSVVSILCPSQLECERQVAFTVRIQRIRTICRTEYRKRAHSYVRGLFTGELTPERDENLPGLLAHAYRAIESPAVVLDRSELVQKIRDVW